MAIDSLSEPGEFYDAERQFCDLVFEIDHVHQRRDWLWRIQSLEFSAIGRVPLGEVGFAACMPYRGWQIQRVNSQLEFYFGQITFCSLGTKTNCLLAFYEDWFGFPQSKRTAVEKLDCAAVIFCSGSLPQFETQKIFAKLVFDAGDASSVAQLALHFDLPSNRAWLLEKEPEFRRPLVDWLAGSYGSSRTKHLQSLLRN